MNARDENENNNTGFGVIRIQVASKSARAPLAGSDRYRYQYSCTGTGTIMIDSLHPLLSGVAVGRNLPAWDPADRETVNYLKTRFGGPTVLLATRK